MKKNVIGLIAVLALAGCTSHNDSLERSALGAVTTPPAPPPAPASPPPAPSPSTAGASCPVFPETVRYFSGNLSGDVTSIGMLTKIAPGAEGQILATLHGVATWAYPPTPIISGGTGGITQLTGDVAAGPGSGVQNARVNATPSDLPGQIVRRDSSSGFSAGTIHLSGGIQFADGTQLSTASPAPSAPNRAYAENSTYQMVSKSIQNDDSIPQNTEGTEILSATITPRSASSHLRITALVPYAHDSAYYCTLALFKDSDANALTATGINSPGLNYNVQLVLAHDMLAGTTSPITFHVRIGPNVGKIYLNGKSGGRIFGGVQKSTLMVEEVGP